MRILIIDNVDLELLERQRLILSTLQPNQIPTHEQMDAIEGIQNMLDGWSDEIYHKEHPFGEGDESL